MKDVCKLKKRDFVKKVRDNENLKYSYTLEQIDEVTDAIFEEMSGFFEKLEGDTEGRFSIYNFGTFVCNNRLNKSNLTGVKEILRILKLKPSVFLKKKINK